MPYDPASAHLPNIPIAALLLKRNEGPAVPPNPTPRPESILVFCKRLQ